MPISAVLLLVTLPGKVNQLKTNYQEILSRIQFQDEFLLFDFRFNVEFQSLRLETFKLKGNFTVIS